MHAVAIFAGVFAISAAMPGADTMLLLGYALGSGPRSAIPLAAGITLGKLMLLALASAGVSAVATSSASFFIVLKVGGALYLSWLGLRMWCRSNTAKTVAPQRSRSAGKAIGTGIVLTVSNPQAIFFYVSVLPAVLGERISVGQYVVLAIALSCVMALIASLYIGLGAHARRFATSSTATAVTQRVAGTVLIGAGVLVTFK